MRKPKRFIGADLGLDGKLPRPCQHRWNVWALHGLHECLLRRGKTLERPHVELLLQQATARADISHQGQLPLPASRGLTKRARGRWTEGWCRLGRPGGILVWSSLDPGVSFKVLGRYGDQQAVRATPSIGALGPSLPLTATKRTSASGAGPAVRMSFAE